MLGFLISYLKLQRVTVRYLVVTYLMNKIRLRIDLQNLTTNIIVV